MTAILGKWSGSLSLYLLFVHFDKLIFRRPIFPPNFNLSESASKIKSNKK